MIKTMLYKEKKYIKYIENIFSTFEGNNINKVYSNN